MKSEVIALTNFVTDGQTDRRTDRRTPIISMSAPQWLRHGGGQQMHVTLHIMGQFICIPVSGFYYMYMLMISNSHTIDITLTF